MLLDMIAAILAGGRATHDIRKDPRAKAEFAVSQVFIALRIPDDETSKGICLSPLALIALNSV